MESARVNAIRVQNREDKTVFYYIHNYDRDSSDLNISLLLEVHSKIKSLHASRSMGWSFEDYIHPLVFL